MRGPPGPLFIVRISSLVKMQVYRRCTQIICHVWLYLALVSSQNMSIPMEYFCTRLGHSTVRKGNAIYAYGGLRDPRAPNDTHVYDRSLIKMDLSYSWDVLKNDRPTSLVSSPNSLEHHASPVAGGSLFYSSDGDFHVYGGGSIAANASTYQRLITSPLQNTIWTLPNSSSISRSLADFEEFSSSFAPMHALSVQAPEQDLAFIFNGIVSNGSTEGAFPNMIIINTRTNDIRIVSTEGISPDTSRVGAVLQYLPLLGKRGALVLFGGSTKSNSNLTTKSWGTMTPLDTIHIFDIASLDTTSNGIWYHQRTSGRTPRSRLTTCSVNIPSPDKTSYHMYMSSGYSPAEIHDDVWVLSLPQFRWTQVFSGLRPNFGSTCHLVGKRQMLFLGGYDSHTSCESPHVALFDLTNLKWSMKFVRDDEAFRVPKAIWEWIGGSAFGDAKVREPERGFESAGLARMFDGMSGAKELRNIGSKRGSRRDSLKALITVTWLSLLLLI